MDPNRLTVVKEIRLVLTATGFPRGAVDLLAWSGGPSPFTLKIGDYSDYRLRSDFNYSS